MNDKEIFVSIQFGVETHLVGTLWCHQKNNRQSASFMYDHNWLKHPERFAIDPALQLTPGTFHTSESQLLFGAIGDSAPDRWGRVLMRRSENARAKANGETPRSLQEADYLLGVHDEARLGALRFSEHPNGPFLADDDKKSIPPLIRLPQLLGATERYLNESESYEDLRLLLLPGSSLGGARPKASIRDHDGSLLLAKFPRKDDGHQVVLWEAVALTLAKKAGIDTVSWRLEKIMDSPVLLIHRFDRSHANRIPFLSAMSMLGSQDYERHNYLEITYALLLYGSKSSQDAEELWRRIVFSILISNTDDHLRNHGFLYTGTNGWRLSPAYDINPVPSMASQRLFATSISPEINESTISAALSVIDSFKIKRQRALEILHEVVFATRNWRQAAQLFGLEKNEIEQMAPAFDHGEMAYAQVICKT